MKIASTCQHCMATFEPRRKDQRLCSPRCKQAAKDQRRKLQRLDRDRKRNGVCPRDYRTKDPASVAAKFRLQIRDGYTKRIAPKAQWVAVDCVIDLDDDFSDYVPMIHPLPMGGPVEMAF